ncbi:MAG: hypothetical protein OEM15_09680 [Myxococcales bacterium]|nr:hypothetical protein [Myxococcales bacterium]MDH3483066.1 hypothetical protein [Myxococcales bacterium]
MRSFTATLALGLMILGWPERSSADDPVHTEEAPQVELEESIAEGSFDEEAPELRMARRMHMILRVGPGGGVAAFNEIDVGFDARTTVGLTLRFEAPVHKVLTTGALWSIYTFGAVERDRNLGMDFSPFLKGRYAFTMGARGLETEVYAIFQFGLSLANVPDNFDYSSFGVGFNTAIAPGFMVFVTDRVAPFFEVGYSYGWARFDGELTGTLSQATLRFGVAVAFY